MMKLYSGDLSPYSARVRMQIYAKGITDIALERPATFGTPKFRQDHPIGRIPVLDIDGDMMPESEVIAEYLEEIYPQPSMLGATPRETAHIRTVARIGTGGGPRQRLGIVRRAGLGSRGFAQTASQLPHNRQGRRDFVVVPVETQVIGQVDLQSRACGNRDDNRRP